MQTANEDADDRQAAPAHASAERDVRAPGDPSAASDDINEPAVAWCDEIPW